MSCFSRSTNSSAVVAYLSTLREERRNSFQCICVELCWRLWRNCVAFWRSKEKKNQLYASVWNTQNVEWMKNCVYKRAKVPLLLIGPLPPHSSMPTTSLLYSTSLLLYFIVITLTSHNSISILKLRVLAQATPK